MPPSKSSEYQITKGPNLVYNKCPTILDAYLVWRNKPILTMYLDVSDCGLMDSKGNIIPLSHKFGEGGFKSEKKNLETFSLIEPEKVAKENNVLFVHPFILNNKLMGKGVTNQEKFLTAFLLQLKEDFSFDISAVNEYDIVDKEKTLRKLLIGATFQCEWAEWWTTSWNKPSRYVGPDGSAEMKVCL